MQTRNHDVHSTTGRSANADVRPSKLAAGARQLLSYCGRSGAKLTAAIVLLLSVAADGPRCDVRDRMRKQASAGSATPPLRRAFNVWGDMTGQARFRVPESAPGQLMGRIRCRRQSQAQRPRHRSTAERERRAPRPTAGMPHVSSSMRRQSASGAARSATRHSPGPSEVDGDTSPPSVRRSPTPVSPLSAPNGETNRPSPVICSAVRWRCATSLRADGKTMPEFGIGAARTRIT